MNVATAKFYNSRTVLAPSSPPATASPNNGGDRSSNGSSETIDPSDEAALRQDRQPR